MPFDIVYWSYFDRAPLRKQMKSEPSSYLLYSVNKNTANLEESRQSGEGWLCLEISAPMSGRSYWLYTVENGYSKFLYLDYNLIFYV